MRPHFTLRIPSVSWLLGLLVAGWQTAAHAFSSGGAKVWFPPAISSYGGEVDRLFYIILWICGIIFILVEGALLWFLIKYRQRPGHNASYVHGNTRAEIIWTVVPALIVIWLAFASQTVWSHIQGPPPPHQLEVAVQAEQFAWNVRYAGADGQLNTDDDIQTINQLHVPIGQVVLVHLTSKDVIHSFFVAELRVKRDAVPGITGRLWLRATQEGKFDIACAELCGLGHYRMKGFMTVEPQETFQAWLEETRANQ